MTKKQPDPSQKQIAKLTAKLRSTWSDDDYQLRAAGDTMGSVVHESWTVPEYSAKEICEGTT